MKLVIANFTPRNLNQQELIRKCVRRNRKAQYTFYKEYYSEMYRICYRYARADEDARALLNLGYAKIMLSLKKYDEAQPLLKWMKTILINTIIDEFRKSRNYREHTTLVEEHALTYMAGAEDKGFFNGEALELIQLRLKELPELTRKVFNLYAVDGYKHKEIAQMLEIPEGTCHWHYSHAKKDLRQYLSSELNIKAS